MIEAIKFIEKMRDDYIAEHCQTFNDGHWVGTPAQTEHVSTLDDIIAKLHWAHEAKRAKIVTAVFSRPECIFNYCPNPEGCRQTCASAALSPSPDRGRHGK